MPLAYLDCFAGLSGDLFLGALVDLGYPADELRRVARAVVGDEAHLEVRREARHGIMGTRVIVEIVAPAHGRACEPAASHEHHHAHDHDHGHDHDHPHDHGHAHSHLHVHASDHGHNRPASPAHAHTGWREIRGRLHAADLPPAVRDGAAAVFERIAHVEAAIHGIPVDEVAFHEVGAVDALVDIVGTVAGVEALHLDPIVSAPPVLGSGFVDTAHGRMPVPAPATLALLAGVPLPGTSPAAGERTTPTGAALAVTLARRFGARPDMVVERIGYGVATQDPREVPNLLRVWVGQPVVRDTVTDPRIRTTRDHVDIVEAEIDDMNPELFGHLTERLRAAGALDVLLTPVQMKKNRPGTSIRVLAPSGAGERLGLRLLTESTTTGARISQAGRLKLEREVRSIETPLGTVRVKVVAVADGKHRSHPEYEDVCRIADQHGLPLVEAERRLVAFLAREEMA